jgi:hypothetical protein
MATNFVPTREADLLAWSRNFDNLISATPTAFGLTAAQATAYSTLHTNFAKAPAKPAVNPKSISMGGLRFVAPPTQLQKVEKPKQPKPPREKLKNDPKLVELARELSAKYLEQVNTGLLLPPSANGKYDVSRQLEAAPSAMKIEPNRLLNAA